MGRRLLYIVAVALAVGFGVRLALAQSDGAPPPPSEPQGAAPADAVQLNPQDLLPPGDGLPAPDSPADMPAGRPDTKAPKAEPAKPATKPQSKLANGLRSLLPGAGGGTRSAPPAKPGTSPPKSAPEPEAGGPALAAPGEGAPAGPEDPLGAVPEQPPALPVPPPGDLKTPALDRDVERTQAPTSPAGPAPGAPPATSANPVPPAQDPSPGQPAAGGTTRDDDPLLLPNDGLPIGSQAVGLSVEAVSPTTINLRQQTTLKIIVRNTGAADARGVVVREKLADSLEFLSSQPAQDALDGTLLVWKLGTVAAQTERLITLNVRPIKPGQFEHAATVTMNAGAKSQTAVKEPKLKVEQLATTGSVLKGKQVEFKITVTNIGDGVARDVIVQAKLSSGLRASTEEGDDQNLFELPIGNLPPHQPIELDPLVADAIAGGEQSCEVVAHSPSIVVPFEGSKSLRTITVVEPKLEMTLAGDEKRFTDTTASYTMTLENPGTATAKNVKIQVTLPLGARPLTQPGARWDPGSRTLYWSFPQLEPGVVNKRTLTFQVRVGAPGRYQFSAAAKGDNLLHAEKLMITHVEGLALVDMEVTPSKKFLDVNGTVVFNIKIRNNGTKEATDILVNGVLTSNLKALQTAGTDEKARSQPTDNGVQVVFPPVSRLAPNQEIVLGIQAQALKPGPASCRAFLVHDKDDETKLEDLAQTRITPSHRQ